MNMTKKHQWITLFLVVFILLLGFFIAIKPRIMILYSFSKNAPIDSAFNRGIEDALAQNRTPVSVNRYYMGTDTLPDSEQMDRKWKEAFDSVQHFNPNVIIAAGQDANRMLASRFPELDPKTTIVFVSVDASAQDLGYPSDARIIGVNRKPLLDGISEFVTGVKGSRQVNLSILGARSISNQVRIDRLLATTPKNFQVSSYLLSSCFDEWQQYIKETASTSDILLVLPTPRLQRKCPGSEGFVERPEFVSWVEANSRPLPIGTDGNFVKNGGAISFYPSYFQEGQSAMEIALSKVDGPRLKGAAPLIHSDDYQIALDVRRLNARKISVPTVYIEFSQSSEHIYQEPER